MLRPALLVSLVVLLPGCEALCMAPALMNLYVGTSDGSPLGEVSVVMVDQHGKEQELVDYGDGYWDFEGSPGTYTVTVTACGGDQVVEEEVDLERDTCIGDKEVSTYVGVELEPC